MCIRDRDKIVEDFIAADLDAQRGDYEKMQVFVNTDLGLPWEEPVSYTHLVQGGGVQLRGFVHDDLIVGHAFHGSFSFVRCG